MLLDEPLIIPDFHLVIDDISSYLAGCVIGRKDKEDVTFFIMLQFAVDVTEKQRQYRQKNLIKMITNNKPHLVKTKNSKEMSMEEFNAFVVEYSKTNNNILITTFPIDFSQNYPKQASNNIQTNSSTDAKELAKCQRKVPAQVLCSILASQNIELRTLLQGESIEFKTIYFSSINHNNIIAEIIDDVYDKVFKDEFHINKCKKLITRLITDPVTIAYFDNVKTICQISSLPHPQIFPRITNENFQKHITKCYDPLVYPLAYCIPQMMLVSIFGQTFFRHTQDSSINNNKMTICLSGKAGSGKSEIINALTKLAPSYQWMKNNGKSGFQNVNIINSYWCYVSELTFKQTVGTMTYKELFDFTASCNVDIKSVQHISCTQYLPVICTTNETMNHLTSLNVEPEHINAIKRRIQFITFPYSCEQSIQLPNVKGHPIAEDAYMTNYHDLVKPIFDQFKYQFDTLCIAMSSFQKEPLQKCPGISTILGKAVGKFSQTLFGMLYILYNEEMKLLLAKLFQLEERETIDIEGVKFNREQFYKQMELVIVNLIKKLCRTKPCENAKTYMNKYLTDSTVPYTCRIVRLALDQGLIKVISANYNQDMIRLIKQRLNQNINVEQFEKGFVKCTSSSVNSNSNIDSTFSSYQPSDEENDQSRALTSAIKKSKSKKRQEDIEEEKSGGIPTMLGKRRIHPDSDYKGRVLYFNEQLQQLDDIPQQPMSTVFQPRLRGDPESVQQTPLGKHQ